MAHPQGDAFGPLEPFLSDPLVTDVFVNPDGTVWVDRGDGLRVQSLRIPRGESRELAVRLIAGGGRHLDDASPCADVRVGDGIRVHGVLPPIAQGGAALSIRVPRAQPIVLDDLEANGFFARIPRAAVDQLVASRANLLITGAAGSGKTTFLAALLAAASSADRIVTVEDVAELRIRHPHVVGLEARQSNLEGAGAIGLDLLVREALRMRPDRLVVGECRGPELRELLTALNTGHDGGAGTLHANSLADVPSRLEALGALVGWSADAVARQAVSAFGAVLHLERATDGSRRLVEHGLLRIDETARLVAEPA